MSTEYAGAVEVEPPLRGPALGWATDAGWPPSPDGRTIRPLPGRDLEETVRGLREMVDAERGSRSYAGAVAAYDEGTRALVAIRVGDGRVTRRTVRRAPPRERSNVIDLATHRRTTSRQIG